MKAFGGFPSRMRFTAIPEPFLGQVLPDMSDMAELKTTLALFRALYQKRGYARFVTLTELKSDVALLKGIGDNPETRGKELDAALEKVVARGTFLRLKVETEQGNDELFFLNSDADRDVMAKVRNGDVPLPGRKTTVPPVVVAEERRPDIFSLYEENIGMLTPMIADEMREAQKHYSETWIHDAIREAANQNKRRWSYISAILERWSSEGRTDGAYRGDTKKADPDKFIKGKYGHMVQR
jgi:DnaD/phage-associated family protein